MGHAILRSQIDIVMIQKAAELAGFEKKDVRFNFIPEPVLKGVVRRIASKVPRDPAHDRKEHIGEVRDLVTQALSLASADQGVDRRTLKIKHRREKKKKRKQPRLKGRSGRRNRRPCRRSAGRRH